jgi:death-on-curing protein
MDKEPEWVKEEVVLALHRRQIAEHGGLEGIRDKTPLESALNKPKNLYNYGHSPSIAELAASYAYGIVNNHPFIDGNKRTGFVVCLLFLQLNGCTLATTSLEKYHIFMALAAGDLTEMLLAKWIEANLLT